METEGSLPHSQVPATCPNPEPARSSPYPPSHFPMSIFRWLGCAETSVQVGGFVCEYFATGYVLTGGVVSTSPKPQAGGPPLAGCPQLFIPYIRSYPQWRAQEFFSGGEGQKIQLRTEDRENGNLGGGSPLLRSSGGSCNLVQGISFHIVKFS